MRRLIRLVVLPAVALWALFATHQVWGLPAASVKTKAACAACHVNPAGGPELTKAGTAFAKAPATAPPADSIHAEYVGSNQCRTCHYKQQKAWAQTRHAHAFETLEKGDPKAVAAMAKALKIELKAPPAKTDACVTCHVTGMGLPGGYPAADSARTAALLHVTCESCHGPGSLHVAAKAEMKKATINGAASARMCTQCHTTATSPKFDFDAYKLRGVHAVPKLGG